MDENCLVIARDNADFKLEGENIDVGDYRRRNFVNTHPAISAENLNERDGLRAVGT